MKKLILPAMIAAMSTLVSVPAKAQTGDSLHTAEGRATAMTEKMKVELSLTEAQYPQVQALNVKYAGKNEAIFQSTEGKFARYRSLKASQKDKSREMKAILDKDQYKKYEAMVGEMKDKARARYKNRERSR